MLFLKEHRKYTPGYRILILLQLSSSIHLCHSLGSESIDTRNIPVNILMKPEHILKGKYYVPTGLNLTATAEIEDEKFRNQSITYQWSTKNTTNTTNTPQIEFKFDSPDPDNFIKLLVFDNLTDSTGTSQKRLVIRDPVVLSDPIGKFFLEHGELLRVTLKFNGTGPFKHCHQFCLDAKVSDCLKCIPNQTTDKGEVDVSHYLRYVGNYSLVFIVDNIVTRLEKRYSVKIIETTRKPTTPYMPIVCSIAAVFILLFGFVLHKNFKQAIFTETADFDFTRQAYD